MLNFFFVTDIHGKLERYESLFKEIIAEKPDAVFIGGDILPSGLFNLTANSNIDDFIEDVLVTGFTKVKEILKKDYPTVFLILGNDDGKFDEERIINISKTGLWEYIHNKKVEYKNYSIYGYSYIPPSPFSLKDWEKYDVSRYVDPGCTPPEEGYHSKKINKNEILYSTIKQDLIQLKGDDNLSDSIFLFHSPPYKTNLDRAALDGKTIKYVPLDVHIGSIAIQRFIKEHQPLITLHGHVHESASITGFWSDRIGKTYCFSAAHNKEELAIVKFNPKKPEEAVRVLI